MTDTNEVLVKKWLQTGDDTVFELVVNAYNSRVYRTVVAMGGGGMAEELTQDVWVRVYKKGHQFRFESAFTTWVYQLTKNIVKTHFIRKKMQQVVSLDWLFENDPGVLASKEMSQYDSAALEDELKLLQSLDFETRYMVILCYVHELPYADIARIMGKPLGTVKSRLNRALEKLRNGPKEVLYVRSN